MNECHHPNPHREKRSHHDTKTVVQDHLDQQMAHRRVYHREHRRH